MATKTGKTTSIRDEYPNHNRPNVTPISQRSGNKVGWRTYKTKAEANTVAKWARVEAKIKSRQGYDFGYCSPGSITKTEDGYEVCIP